MALLQQTLAEEKETDQKLTKLAEVINLEANDTAKRPVAPGKRKKPRAA